MKKWIFNPFIYVAGSKALLTGWIVMLATACIGYISHTHFDGAIDVHTRAQQTSFITHLAEQIIDWSSCTFLFYLAGKLFSRSSIRFIDVAGTFALSRWPLIFPSIIGFGIHAPDSKNVDTILKSITPTTIALSMMSLVFVIWMIALLYNAFTTSCNLKGGKAVAIFIITLLLSEILSKIALHFV